MEPFVCPTCGHRSTFDPIAGPAVCSRCGYTPPTDRRVIGEPTKEPEPAKHARRSKVRAEISLSLLQELLSHWDGTHIPDHAFRLPTAREARAFFKMYERSLTGDTSLRPGSRVRYVRSYKPEKKAVLWFVRAYILLRQGERANAAQHLHDLARVHPEFPDPWVWLSATTDDPAQRIDYLENAVLLESAHPLARDALAIAQGRVSRPKTAQEPEAVQQLRIVNCPKCGGAFHYEPGATVVACRYCGHGLELRETDLIDREATLMGDLQLQRRLEGHIWKEVQRVAHCQACGAELTMTQHLTRQCVFCGSMSVLAKDTRQSFEQPDGFVPFKLDQEEAIAAIGKAQRLTSQRLRTWWSGREEDIKQVQGVYLPFWVFDGFVEVRRRTWNRPGGETLPASSWLAGEPVRLGGLSDGAWLRRQIGPSGEQEASLPSKDLLVFDNLLFSAMDFPPAELLKQTFPFELGGLVPYEPRLLANWPAALYHRDVEVVGKDAYNTMLYKAVWRKRTQLLSQAGDLEQLRRMFQVTTVTYQLVLLPVWAALAQRVQECRLVLVNGQNGKVAFSGSLQSRSKQ